MVCSVRHKRVAGKDRDKERAEADAPMPGELTYITIYSDETIATIALELHLDETCLMKRNHFRLCKCLGSSCPRPNTKLGRERTIHYHPDQDKQQSSQGKQQSKDGAGGGAAGTGGGGGGGGRPGKSGGEATGDGGGKNGSVLTDDWKCVKCKKDYAHHNPQQRAALLKRHVNLCGVDHTARCDLFMTYEIVCSHPPHSPNPSCRHT